ncbi:MAG: S4 domain-containing protein [Acidobacteriota bacterium]|jgi:ribosome-associated heat shock protein Hsp15
MEVRLDKWLQVARMFKTRSQATRACSLSRVKVNGQVAKPHKTLSVGDSIEIERKDDWTQVIEVRELRDKPVRKDRAADLYEDRSPPRPKLTELEKLMQKPLVRRERGKGRPTKKERRQMDRWRSG